MTPTEAYRAALEAAASYTASKWFLEDRGRKEMEQSPLGEHLAAIIRALPVPDEPKRSFPEAADGSPSLPMEPELWAAGCDLETARFVARQLAAGGYTLTESDELDRLRAENERLRALAVKAQWALQPFSDCVFDDNGDLTVTVSYRAVTVSALRGAYFAYKAIRSALKGGE